MSKTTDVETHNELLEVELVTRGGKAKIKVPPYLEWSSSARHALSGAGGGDDYLWATRTLDEVSLSHWRRLDPTGVEVGAFFERVMAQLGGISLGESRASSL